MRFHHGAQDSVRFNTWIVCFCNFPFNIFGLLWTVGNRNHRKGNGLSRGQACTALHTFITERTSCDHAAPATWSPHQGLCACCPPARESRPQRPAWLTPSPPSGLCRNIISSVNRSLSPLFKITLLPPQSPCNFIHSTRCPGHTTSHYIFVVSSIHCDISTIEPGLSSVCS